MNLSFLRKYAVAGPFLLIGLGIILAMSSLYLFAKIAEYVLLKETFRFDEVVSGWMDIISSPFVDQVMIMITETGSVWWLTFCTILVTLWLLFKRRDIWGVLFFIIANAGGGLLNRTLKEAFERTRPSINPGVDGVGFSFPSGHAMGAMIFYGFLSYLIIRSRRKKETKVILTVISTTFIILIGISRIYLNVHYPTDVVAGYAAGLIWLITCIFALEIVRWLRRRSDERIVKIK